jgi:hypothetical protein
MSRKIKTRNADETEYDKKKKKKSNSISCIQNILSPFNWSEYAFRPRIAKRVTTIRS